MATLAKVSVSHSSILHYSLENTEKTQMLMSPPEMLTYLTLENKALTDSNKPRDVLSLPLLHQNECVDGCVPSTAWAGWSRYFRKCSGNLVLKTCWQINLLTVALAQPPAVSVQPSSATTTQSAIKRLDLCCVYFAKWFTCIILHFNNSICLTQWF